jgi:hypothetical protein
MAGIPDSSQRLPGACDCHAHLRSAFPGDARRTRSVEAGPCDLVIDRIGRFTAPVDGRTPAAGMGSE